jgi:hypothetical protein
MTGCWLDCQDYFHRRDQDLSFAICISHICTSKKYIWSLQALHSWPHYAVLVDEGDDTGSHLTYVVQEQLELMKNTEVSAL